MRNTEKRKINGGETIDGETGKVDPYRKGRRIPLKTVRQVHREMAYCYRESVNGDLDSAVMTKRIYALDRILNSVHVAELEKELAELHARLSGRGTTPLMLPSQVDHNEAIQAQVERQVLAE